MKKSLLMLIMLISVSLTGCFTSTKVKEEQEQIQAFFINQDKLYVLGKQQDYLLDSIEVQLLRHFLQSPYAKGIKQFSISLDVNENGNVDGLYSVEVDANKVTALPDKQRGALGLRPDLTGDYRSSGKVMIFENRQALLKQYALSRPLPAKVNYFRNEFSASETSSTILLVPLIAPVAIIGAVIAFPIYTAVGITCTIQHCDEK